jgi:hypothetical protein
VGLHTRFRPQCAALDTCEGTPEHALLNDIGRGHEADCRLYFHGMLTYDYFSIAKTVRDRDGHWLDPADWTEIKFPLALVVFGEVA